MSMDVILKTGDRVRLNGRYHGYVKLASENGRSVLIDLEDGLPLAGGIYLNFAALSVDYENQVVTDLFTGTEISVETV